MEKMESEEIVRGIWNDSLFILFMKKRFPNEKSEAYIEEWRDRFKSGNPLAYMDEDSVKCYIKAIEEIYLKILN